MVAADLESPALNSVVHVLSMGADDEMTSIPTRRVVTRVANLHALRDRPVEVLVDENMDREGDATQSTSLNHPVPVGMARSSVLVARIRPTARVKLAQHDRDDLLSRPRLRSGHVLDHTRYALRSQLHQREGPLPSGRGPSFQIQASALAFACSTAHRERPPRHTSTTLPSSSWAACWPRCASARSHTWPWRCSARQSVLVTPTTPAPHASSRSGCRRGARSSCPPAPRPSWRAGERSGRCEGCSPRSGASEPAPALASPWR